MIIGHVQRPNLSVSVSSRVSVLSRVSAGSRSAVSRMSVVSRVSVLSRVLVRLPLCLSCFRFAFYEHFCRFFDSFDKKSSFSLIILSFKENWKNWASSTSKICQLMRSDKKHNGRKIEKNPNPEDRDCLGHGTRLIIITRWQASHWIVSS